MSTPSRTMRIPDSTWDPFTDNTRVMGTDNSRVTRQFQDWYNGVEGAELPIRPCDLDRDVDPAEAMRRHRMVANTVAGLKAVFAAALLDELTAELERASSPERVNV